MTIEQRTSKLIEALLIAQISNVDPDDAETIMSRWACLIADALKQAQDDVRQNIYTEVCFNEKCPRGSGVPVEVIRPAKE